ncbi:MAG: urea ABC transporter permease subunit UrtC [Pseudanabaena sp. SU_2_4]|nr:urea ABC transporter permease subunit UrtC [Pseudanabaena sp. SU_2_4]
MTSDLAIESSAINPQKHKLLIEVAIVAAIALVLVFLMPRLLNSFWLELLGKFLAYSIVALGIDLIWGYTGLLSLGHGVFFGLGGYALAMHVKLQVPPDATSQLPDFMSLYGVTELPWFWNPFHSLGFATAAAVILPAVIGGLLGYMIFRNRIRGVYFSILTQATTVIFYNFFNGQQKLFNGTNGLTDFKTIVGATVSASGTKYVFYCLIVVFLALTYALCRWLTSGTFGRLLVAIRDDESRVRFSGYDPTGYKVLVFAISAALAGIGGALFAGLNGSISPRFMNITSSIDMVIWVAVGGRASLVGAVLGTVLVKSAENVLSEKFPDTWLFFQGAIFLLVVMLLPNGVVGWLRTQGMNYLRTLLGMRKASDTYPSLEENLEEVPEDLEITDRGSYEGKDSRD